MIMTLQLTYSTRLFSMPLMFVANLLVYSGFAMYDRW